MAVHLPQYGIFSLERVSQKKSVPGTMRKAHSNDTLMKIMEVNSFSQGYLEQQKKWILGKRRRGGFIEKNWLKQLWRLRSVKICKVSQQVDQSR
jgi:hypothetical protein